MQQALNGRRGLTEIQGFLDFVFDMNEVGGDEAKFLCEI